MALKHRLDRLEQDIRKARGDGCPACRPDPDHPEPMRVEFAEDNAAHNAAAAAGGLPEDFCPECGRQLAMRIVFDDAG